MIAALNCSVVQELHHAVIWGQIGEQSFSIEKDAGSEAGNNDDGSVRRRRGSESWGQIWRPSSCSKIIDTSWTPYLGQSFHDLSAAY